MACQSGGPRAINAQPSGLFALHGWLAIQSKERERKTEKEKEKRKEVGRIVYK